MFEVFFYYYDLQIQLINTKKKKRCNVISGMKLTRVQHISKKTNKIHNVKVEWRNLMEIVLLGPDKNQFNSLFSYRGCCCCSCVQWPFKIHVKKAHSRHCITYKKTRIDIPNIPNIWLNIRRSKFEWARKRQEGKIPTYNMDILPSGNIFRELQDIQDTGYFSSQVSIEDQWQQVCLILHSPHAIYGILIGNCIIE